MATIRKNKNLSLKEKRKQDEIQRSMDEIIPVMREGYSLEEAAKKVGINPSDVKKWYDKGWHKEGEFYINFFKQVRALKYSNKSVEIKRQANKNSKLSKLTDTQKQKVLNEFNDFLNSEKGFIDNTRRRFIKNKFNTSLYNYYSILNFRRIIDDYNKKFIENEKNIILDEFNSYLDSNNCFIDKKSLEDKYHKSYYNYYSVLNMGRKIDNHNEKFIENEKNIILDEFNSFLDSQEGFIDNSIKESFKKKYYRNYCNYYSILNMGSRIDDYNKKFIENERSIILVEFNSFLNSKNEFIVDSIRESFKKKYNKTYFNYYDELNMDELINKFNSKFINDFKKDLKDKYISNSEKIELTKSLNHNFDITDIIEEHNNEFIEKQMELDSKFFDNVDNRSLDINQRIAVLTDDDNTQIVAGAGTGKTLTIQAKVKYLIEKKGVKPEDILCISFSNSARDDLAKKLERTIGNNLIEVRTFHSLGYSILGRNGQGKEVPEHEISDLINDYFKESLNENSDLIKDIVEFFCYYYNIVYRGMDNLKFETFRSRLTTLNEYDEYLSEYLQISNVKKTKEYMSNVKDLIVSNFLFIHNIEYDYLKQAIFKVKDYDKYISRYFNYLFCSFDEYIPDNIKLKLVNEIDENFACTKLDYYPNFYLPNEDLYIDLVPFNSIWKRILEDEDREKISKNFKKIENINKSHKTKLLTIFDYNGDVDALLENLQNNLSNNNVELANVDYNTLFEKLISQDTLPEYKRFIQTVESFINLFKGNSKNIDYEGNDISKQMFDKYLTENHEINSHSLEKRNAFFLRIIEKIYERYANNLKNNYYIDFNDMINEAIIELRNGAYIHDYKYVIVDEYQDTSYTRYNLLQEVQNATGAKVVVVGDDWQSIYGFTGCDVNLFSQFDKYFDNPKMVKINITRRNSQKLINVVGEFIQQNPYQIKKKLKSDKLNDKPIKIFEYVSRAEEVLAFINILEKISNEKEDANVLILGRNNYDIYNIICKEIFSTIPFKDYTAVNYVDKPDLNIEFRTVHKSKGLQSDYVIVLNLNDQINGFPNKIVDDPILDFVNNKQDEEIEYPEERRLFYVALTRTMNDVYLFANSKRPSIFINEIIDKEGVEILNYTFSNDEIMYINQLLQKRFEVIETGVTCPKCNVGNVNLIINNEKGTSYFRCSNFCGWEGAPYHNTKEDDGTRRIAYVKYVEACPREGCQGIRIVRKNSNDGSLFLGCTSYPECRFFTKSLNITDEIVDNIIFDIEFNELNRTRYGVYYLSEYIPEDKRDDYDKKDVNFSKRLIGYKKDTDNYSVNLFTQDLIQLISQLSHNELQNKSKLALIAVPSSKVNKIRSSMKKSIDIIEEIYNSGELDSEFNCDCEIINYKDLLKRVKDVPTAHLGEGRASCDEHIDSIKCMKDNLSNENIAYIILDDITTTGNSMRACNEILLQSGVKMENIYNIALGATVRDDNEEI